MRLSMARSRWSTEALDEVIRDRGEPPAELVVAHPSEDLRCYNDRKLHDRIQVVRCHLNGPGLLPGNLPDQGKKLQARLRFMEEELDRRKRLKGNAGNLDGGGLLLRGGWKSRERRCLSLDVVLLDEDDAVQDNDNSSHEMLSVKIYYPTRDDADCVEICYQDLKCLDPESYLSSPVMNFYIQYIQKSTLLTGGAKGEYYFFNTYFYSKLVESLSSKSDCSVQLSKLRRWFKGINLFQKAYIFMPVHGSMHWSLVIICIPVKDDGIGPILFHLDSLGIHDSNGILQNIERYLIKEWNHMVRTCGSPADVPVSDEVWRDLPNRIVKRTIVVPQQKNPYDCGLFVLYFMERFIIEAPERASKKDLHKFGCRWFDAEEASGLRKRLRELLMEEFENARLNENDVVSSQSSLSSYEAS